MPLNCWCLAFKKKEIFYKGQEASWCYSSTALTYSFPYSWKWRLVLFMELFFHIVLSSSVSLFSELCWQYRPSESRKKEASSNHEDVRNATFIMFHLVQYRKHLHIQGNELAKLSSHTCIHFQKARTKTRCSCIGATINTALTHVVALYFAFTYLP